MKLINLTPHFINLYQGEECVLSIPSSGVLRAKEEINSTIDVEFEGIKTTIVNKTLGIPYLENDDKKPLGDILEDIIGIPYYAFQGKFVVSMITLQAIQDYFPNLEYYFITTDNLVRDENGMIIGCRGFAQ